MCERLHFAAVIAILSPVALWLWLSDLCRPTTQEGPKP